MWTDEQREKGKRRSDRYPSDLTDAEWEQMAPLIPPARTGGRPRKTDMRDYAEHRIMLSPRRPVPQ